MKKICLFIAASALLMAGCGSDDSDISINPDNFLIGNWVEVNAGTNDPLPNGYKLKFHNNTTVTLYHADESNTVDYEIDGDKMLFRSMAGDGISQHDFTRVNAVKIVITDLYIHDQNTATIPIPSTFKRY
jgi:hypothetical protein